MLEDLKKENKKLKLEIKFWKDKWLSQREIIGRLGYDNIPDIYTNDMLYLIYITNIKK
jgi:hypothetical protein